MQIPDPRALKPAERKALAALDRIALVRAPGGWRQRGGPGRMTLAMADRLKGLGLASVTYAERNPRLILTYAGRAVVGVMQERQT